MSQVGNLSTVKMSCEVSAIAPNRCQNSQKEAIAKRFCEVLNECYGGYIFFSGLFLIIFSYIWSFMLVWGLGFWG